MKHLASGNYSHFTILVSLVTEEANVCLKATDRIKVLCHEMSPYLQILDCKCSVTNSEVNLVEYKVYLNDPLFNNIFN